MCTSVMAGAAATEDGVVLLARNEDYTRDNWNKYLEVRTRPAYAGKQPGEPWALGNGLTVPTPALALRYGAMPDAAGQGEASLPVGDHYFFEERGVNERSVGISATNSLAIGEAASQRDPLLAAGGVAECVIPTLVLPQATTAREAVRILGATVEHQGASEVNGVLIADPHEAWYFENGSGHTWIAVRVPDDAYVAVANEMRIHGVDLDSPDVLCSEGLYDKVVEWGLLPAPRRDCFDFAAAFGKLGDPASHDRVWLAQSILTPSRVQPTGLDQYPLFLRPDQRIRVDTVMAVLRATYVGTPLEGKETRTIGWNRTAESHVITLDPAMPPPLQGIVWQALSTPMSSPYLPLYAAMERVPEAWRRGGGAWSASSAFWAFRGVHTLADAADPAGRAHVHATWRTQERQSLDEQPHLRRALAAMAEVDLDLAVAYAARYSTGVASEALLIADELRSWLMTRLTTQDTQPR